jgi:ABC-type Co2+ transport system permease subunit
MSRAVSAGARRFVVASASYFVASQLAILAVAGESGTALGSGLYAYLLGAAFATRY